MANSAVPGNFVAGADSSEQHPRLRWLVLLMAVASAVCAMMVTISFSPIIGIVAQDIGVDLGSASFAFIGAPTFAMASGMAVSGFLIDRLGVFRIVIGSLVTLIVSDVAIWIFGHSYAALLIIRLIQGLSSAGLMVSITPAIAQWFPRNEIGRVMGFPSIGSGIGMIIGLNATPLLSRHLGSWQQGTAILSIVAACALVIAVRTARLARGSTRPLLEFSDQSSRQFVSSLQPQAINLLRLPIFWIGMGVIAMAGWANMAFNDLAPGFLSVPPPVGVGYGPQQAGGLMSLAAISGVLGAPLAGVLMDTIFRRRNRSAILLGFVISATSFSVILLPSVHSHRTVLASALLIGGLANPFVNVTLMSIGAKTIAVGAVGRICGLWMSASFFAGSVGVLVGSLALRTSGNYQLSLMIVGVASVAGLLVSALLPKRIPDSPLGLRSAIANAPFKSGPGRTI